MLALAVLAGSLGLAPDAALAASSKPSSFYYYADGQRIPLAVSTQWAAVKFADADPTRQAEALQEAGAPLDASATPRDLPNTGLRLLPISPGVGEEALVHSLQAMRQSARGIQDASPVFLAADAEMIVTDEFVAAFRPGMGHAQINRINARHGVSIVRALLGQPNTFVLSVAPGSEQDALAMSNLYKESGEALSAAPNFLLIMAPDGAAASRLASGVIEPGTPNDAMFSYQWHLHNRQQYGTWTTPDNDIDAPEAWLLTNGDLQVVIAIVDEGVELTHEDLPHVVGGYDATGNGSAGAPCSAPCGNADDWHGTAVAGLAAASANNTIGVAGVCPNCSIMPVRIAQGDGAGHWLTTSAAIADGISWAYLNGASVINLSFVGPAATVITTAINNARTKGRGGKGAVVVGAAGNDGRSSVGYPASLANVIAVGAINLCAARKTAAPTQCNHLEDLWASNYGSALDLSAPGILLATTDRSGAAGYYPVDPIWGGNYDDVFNGTSGAAPIVSGVAGLVLTVNPDLTAAQVQTVLTKNAEDLPPAGKDAQTGFGRVNAQRAVTAALAMRVMTNVNHGPALVDSIYVPGLSVALAPYPYSSVSPARVASSDGLQKRIVSLVTRSYLSGNLLSYTEMMGLPKSQLYTEYWLPWYKNPVPVPGTLAPQTLYVVNADHVYSNKVQIYAAGGQMTDDLTLGPGATAGVALNVDTGPIRVRSSNGKKLIVSLFSQGVQSSTVISSSQMMALPRTQLATEYYFPWYDNSDPATLAEDLLIGNADLNYAANVQVLVGNTVLDSFTLKRNESISKSYPMAFGPLRVRSTNSKKIIVSLSETYAGSTVSQWMGIPKPKITHTYYFADYVNAEPISETFRLVNVDVSPTNVEIMIGGVVVDTYSLGPGESATPRYDMARGPVRVRSTNGKKILASIEMSALVSGVPQSYHELMGLPYTVLSAEYWFPLVKSLLPALEEGLMLGRP